MKNFVSIIIPLFNMENLIRETVVSVLKQTWKDWELIIVDDGSTDKSSEIIRSFKDSRIRYFYQKNSGLPASVRNRGVEFSKGEFIAFLDHDDLWMPDKLEKQINMIKKDDKIALISTNVYYIYNNKKTIIPFSAAGSSGYYNNAYLFPESKIIQSTVLMNKKVFYDVGGLNESKELKAVEDYDLWIRVYKKYPCYFINECLAYYRILTGSTSGGRIKSMERRLNYFKNHFIKYGFSNEINQLNLYNAFFRLGIVRFFSGDTGCRMDFNEAFKTKKTLAVFFLKQISRLPNGVLKIFNPMPLYIRVSRFIKSIYYLLGKFGNSKK